MNSPFSLRIALLSMVATSLVAGPAMATGYVGAAIGQGKITASDPDLGPDQFIEHDTAFKLVAGVKGPLGFELEYIDFGESRGTLDGEAVNGKLNALAAFAVLPIPDLVPIVDVYGKAGFARLDTKVSGELQDFSSRSTKFAWGLGAKFKAGPITVRAEYEKFHRHGRDPAVLSLGFVKYLGRKD